jgi:hypothetical protein
LLGFATSSYLSHHAFAAHCLGSSAVARYPWEPMSTRRFRGSFLLFLACASMFAAHAAHAQSALNAVLGFDYTPTARAQVAIWIEDADGNFMATVKLTEAVAYRGIGNRPGASEMNSGYRWPYGRREGVLPIWATRRASAEGAQRFVRVIFQSRVEGLASRTANDQSVDNYYCLSFDTAKSARDALDAMACASVFNSDKGRYMKSSDVSAAYAEPYEAIGTHAGSRVPIPGTSLYPPRMDVTRCSNGSTCFDTADMATYVDDARAVMPDIDAVTMATPPGDTAQSVLFTVPTTWAPGNYVAWLEVNVEGDYNSTWSAAANPTPQTPSSDWDSWARNYGYPYRGQPSIAFRVPFTLGAVGQDQFSTDAPEGRASWDVWGPGFGVLNSASDLTDDPDNAPGSGADRLRKDGDGHRLIVRTNVLDMPPPVDPGDPGNTDPPPTGDPGDGNTGGAGTGGSSSNSGSTGSMSSGGTMGGTTKPTGDGDGKGMVIEGTGGGVHGPVGPIYDLELRHHEDKLRSHTWITMRMRAARSDLPIHSYDVRYGTEPIVDEKTFIRNGRQAKNATDDAEGATLLMLPTDVPEGKVIEGDIGDLVALTHYYIAVRATDDLNRHGPISVAEITTTKRNFATVTPCFVATAAYGTPLAAEIGALRALRDRYLLPNAVGRAFVSAYYKVGPHLARVIAEHETLRSAARTLLTPLVSLAQYLAG